MPVLSGYGQKIEVVSVKGGIQADTNIKKVILYKIAESTGIYFDGCGVKKHFYEPENIRELVNLYSVLNKIDCLADEGDIPRFVPRITQPLTTIFLKSIVLSEPNLTAALVEDSMQFDTVIFWQGPYFFALSVFLNTMQSSAPSMKQFAILTFWQWSGSIPSELARRVLL